MSKCSVVFLGFTAWKSVRLPFFLNWWAFEIDFLISRRKYLVSVCLVDKLHYLKILKFQRNNERKI